MSLSFSSDFFFFSNGRDSVAPTIVVDILVVVVLRRKDPVVGASNWPQLWIKRLHGRFFGTKVHDPSEDEAVGSVLDPDFLVFDHCVNRRWLRHEYAKSAGFRSVHIVFEFMKCGEW